MCTGSIVYALYMYMYDVCAYIGKDEFNVIKMMQEVFYDISMWLFYAIFGWNAIFSFVKDMCYKRHLNTS